MAKLLMDEEEAERLEQSADLRTQKLFTRYRVWRTALRNKPGVRGLERSRQLSHKTLDIWRQCCCNARGGPPWFLQTCVCSVKWLMVIVVAIFGTQNWLPEPKIGSKAQNWPPTHRIGFQSRKLARPKFTKFRFHSPKLDQSPKLAPKAQIFQNKAPRPRPGRLRISKKPQKAPRPQIRSQPPAQNKMWFQKKTFAQNVSVKTFRSKLSFKTFAQNLLEPKPYTISINPKP